MIVTEPNMYALIRSCCDSARGVTTCEKYKITDPDDGSELCLQFTASNMDFDWSNGLMGPVISDVSLEHNCTKDKAHHMLLTMDVRNQDNRNLLDNLFCPEDKVGISEFIDDYW